MTAQKALATEQASVTRNSKIGIGSIGPVLMRLASSYYKTLLAVILEAAQNANDAEATAIFVSINEKTRTVSISDNGRGTSVEGFEAKLLSTCRSAKSNDKYGQFGLGFISFFGKCERAFFTSCPHPRNRGYVQWEFVTSDAERDDWDGDIPPKVLPDILYAASGSGGNKVPWRTELKLVNYTGDARINRIPSAEMVAQEIISKYRTKMIGNDTKLTVIITRRDGKKEKVENMKATPIKGRRLPVVMAIPEPRSAGAVRFELYLAEKGSPVSPEKRVTIGVAGALSRVTADDFVESTKELLKSEVRLALVSGVFEGDIVAARITLDPNRKSFLEDEALLEFCDEIDDWYFTSAKTHFDSAHEETTQKKYQQVSMRVLENLSKMLQDKRFESIRNLLGTSARPKKGEPAELASATSASLSVAPKSPTASPKKDQPEGMTRDKCAKNGKDKQAAPVAKDVETKARPRTRKEGFGLELVTEPIPMGPLWELDLSQGLLRFNCLHEDFILIEKGGLRRLQQFKEMLCLLALELAAMPDDWRETAGVFAQEHATKVAMLLSTSKVFTSLGEGFKDS